MKDATREKMHKNAGWVALVTALSVPTLAYFQARDARIAAEAAKAKTTENGHETDAGYKALVEAVEHLREEQKDARTFLTSQEVRLSFLEKALLGVLSTRSSSATNQDRKIQAKLVETLGEERVAPPEPAASEPLPQTNKAAKQMLEQRGVDF